MQVQVLTRRPNGTYGHARTIEVLGPGLSKVPRRDAPASGAFDPTVFDIDLFDFELTGYMESCLNRLDVRARNDDWDSSESYPGFTCWKRRRATQYRPLRHSGGQAH